MDQSTQEERGWGKCQSRREFNKRSVYLGLGTAKGDAATAPGASNGRTPLPPLDLREGGG